MTTPAPPIRPPARRRLRIFGFDPMTSRLAGGILTVDVPMEDLDPGPVGHLLQVVDLHGPTGTWFVPVDLDEPALIHQDGIRPSESDPRSHQQIVYAVASSVIERFERFLGRRFRWASDQRLVLIPHAFEGRNAYFDPERKAVLFGYFRADPDSPGRTLPGQTIFTCLSLDIVAHEVTHALVHRLRRHYVQPTNPDVLAWHEAFADLVALFHHFVFPEVVTSAVRTSRGDLTAAQGLFDLAAEFGESTGRGQALRSAIATRPATGPGSSTTPFPAIDEPHQRGAVFVSAVFDAFVDSYRQRIADLLRIATGGTGVLPPGHLHPDLVARVAKEATTLADRYLGMVVRSFDRLPVLDVTFGDVMRAIVTADRDLHPDDDAGLRANLVEAFRARGIYPEDARSLAEESLAWPVAEGFRPMSAELRAGLHWLVADGAQQLDPAGDVVADERTSSEGDATADAGDPGSTLAGHLLGWAREHAIALGFTPDPKAKLQLVGRHVSFRQAQDRQPQPEVVIQLTQRREDLVVPGLADVRAGTTIVVTMTGHVRYVVAKPLPDAAPESASWSEPRRRNHRLGLERLRRMRLHVGDLEHHDLAASWRESTDAAHAFALLHLSVEEEEGR